jgi:hypothetical protein
MNPLWLPRCKPPIGRAPTTAGDGTAFQLRYAASLLHALAIRIEPGPLRCQKESIGTAHAVGAAVRCDRTRRSVVLQEAAWRQHLHCLAGRKLHGRPHVSVYPALPVVPSNMSVRRGHTRDVAAATKTTLIPDAAVEPGG